MNSFLQSNTLYKCKTLRHMIHMLKAAKSAFNFFENSVIVTNNIRFHGQYFDEETAHHYNRYRYYSPYVGRFISKDPIGLLGGFNVYAYAPNSTSWIDALGLKSEWQKNWEVVHGTLPKDYEVHHIIPKSASSVRAAKTICPNFEVNNSDNLIALPKNSNVKQITGAGFGKTTHNGYHKGYSQAAEGAMNIAARMKSSVPGCKRLAIIQAGLKNQLIIGGQTMYGKGHPNGVPGVKSDWKGTVRNHVRGK